MAVFDLFSKAERRAKGDVPDVWVYDSLPEPFRVQVVHIWREVFGPTVMEGYGITCPVKSAFRSIGKILCKEYGLFQLTRDSDDAFTDVANFFLGCRDVARCLDVIQLTFAWIDTGVRERGHEYYRSELGPDEAIEELNARFREHGIGYSYERRRIIRIDSQLVHAEVVKPALHFLSEPFLAGANEEFLNAHQHYRAGRNKECVADSLKAFESTMKAICDRRKWTYSPNDTAKPLIDVLFKQKLIPDYLQSEFAALRTVLESGVPTLRNRTSGHGQGAIPVELPAFLASYVLHLTGSTILFLCEANKNLK